MPSFPNSAGLMIAVPHSGKKVVPEFAWSLMNVHPPMNFYVQYASVKGKPVDEARNWIIDEAKMRKVKYLFFIDDDVTIPGHALQQLIFRMEHNPDIDVLGGVYVGKGDWSTPLVFRGNGGGSYWDWKVGEFFQCSGIGMGCTIIRMSIFDAIEKPYFKTVNDMEDLLKGVNNSEHWTEDLYFCEKVTKSGGEVWCDASILCAHWDDEGMPHMLPPESAPCRRLYAEPGKKKIVDLGAGKRPYVTDEGTVWTVDIREDANPDYRCDLRLLPFGDKEFDVVHSSHALEHFPRKDVKSVLAEWVRILKDDGEMRLALPNLQWAADLIAKGEMSNVKYNEDILNVMYGAQAYPTDFHYVGFTPDMVCNMLKDRGFKSFNVEAEGYNMFIRAWKFYPHEDPSAAAAKPVEQVGDDPLFGSSIFGKPLGKAKPAVKKAKKKSK